MSSPYPYGPPGAPGYQYPYPPNYYYPPPPAYWPPAYYRPPEYSTREGVKFFSWALLVQIIVALLGFSAALVASAAMRSTTDTTAILSALAGLMVFSILVIVLGIINFVLILVGIIKFYMGKWEHGPQHDKDVFTGIVLFVIGFVLPIMGSVAMMGVIFSAMFSGGGNLTTNTLLLMEGVLGAFNTAAAFCNALMYRSFVRVFIRPEDRTFRAAMLLMVINPLVSLGIVAALLPSNLPYDSASSLLSPALGIGGMLGLAALYLFHKGYRTILERMGSGEIRQGGVPGEHPEVVLATEHSPGPNPPQWPR